MTMIVNTGDIEVEKPSGGGKGQKVLYYVEIVIDGVAALHLQRFHFKQPGQMEMFAEAMKKLTQ